MYYLFIIFLIISETGRFNFLEESEMANSIIFNPGVPKRCLILLEYSRILGNFNFGTRESIVIFLIVVREINLNDYLKFLSQRKLNVPNFLNIS